MDPALAARASEDITGGLSSSRGAFRAQSRQLREGIDEGLGEVAANPEATIGEIDRLLSQGTLPPGDLAYLRNLRADIAPRKMADIGGGQLVPIEDVPAEFRGIVPVIEQPRTAAEIQSQIKGMAQNLPYRQGEGVFGTPELKKGIAGRLKAEMSDLVKKADPELGARLARADAFHASNVDPFKADWAKRAFRLKKSGQVSKVGDIINPQMATEDIEQIIKTTGAKDAIGASVLEDIISKASDKTGAVDPTKLAREIGKWRPGNLQAILTQN